MTKTHLLGALAICLLASGAPLAASEHGWIATIDNQSDYPLTVQNSDNGFGNAIKADNACVAGRGGEFYVIGCASFTVPAHTSLKTKSFVVPYANQKGIITMNLSKFDNFGKPAGISWTLQEVNSKVTINKDGGFATNYQRDGQCFYTLTIQPNNSAMTVQQLGSKPSWFD
jgi:hypothetical protein